MTSRLLFRLVATLLVAFVSSACEGKNPGAPTPPPPTPSETEIKITSVKGNVDGKFVELPLEGALEYATRIEVSGTFKVPANTDMTQVRALLNFDFSAYNMTTMEGLVPQAGGYPELELLPVRLDKATGMWGAELEKFAPCFCPPVPLDCKKVKMCLPTSRGLKIRLYRSNGEDLGADTKKVAFTMIAK